MGIGVNYGGKRAGQSPGEAGMRAAGWIHDSERNRRHRR